MDRDLTNLNEAMEQWEALRQSLLDLRETIAKFVVPAWEKMVVQIRVFIIWVRREQLYWSLTKWKVPEQFARWLADKWPERWLPELKFD